MKKSAAAKLHTRNLGTSILLREKIRTKTTMPLPNIAHKNTIHTPQRSVHQSNRSWHGRKGPGKGKHWIFPGAPVEPSPEIRRFRSSSAAYSSMYEGKFPGYVKSDRMFSHISSNFLPNL